MKQVRTTRRRGRDGVENDRIGETDRCIKSNVREAMCMKICMSRPDVGATNEPALEDDRELPRDAPVAASCLAMLDDCASVTSSNGTCTRMRRDRARTTRTVVVG